MPPNIKCPNCGQREWLENPILSYLPETHEVEKGVYVADSFNGAHVRLWRCNNCMFIMQFWEPD